MLQQCPLSARTGGSGGRLLRSPGMKARAAVATVLLVVGTYSDSHHYPLR